MKHLYELPTDDVIVNCLANDVIGRNQDVVNFCSIIDSFKYSTIVALDGSWGSGKTFFVKQAKMLIDWKCKRESLDEKLQKNIDQATKAHPDIYDKLSFERKHSTVYYDAWENDDDTDPILSILYSIIKSEQVELHVSHDRGILQIISSLADCVTGRSISAFFEAIKGEDFFEELKKRESIDELIRNFFNAAIGESCNRLVIFIDELDRCNPSFAVRLLERIKHYFNDERLTFVFSLNRDQLQHTICNFYGNGMNGSKYLDKFFDLNIQIPKANKVNFLAKIGFVKSIYVYDIICFAAIDYCDLELREITKFYQHIKLTTYDEAHEKVNERYGEFTMSFCTIFIVPILTALQLSDLNQFHKFINGEDEKPLTEILSSSEITSASQHWLLDSNEIFATSDSSDSRTRVDYKKRLQDVYHALFQQNYVDLNSIRVGAMKFNSGSKDKVLRLINPISKAIK